MSKNHSSTKNTRLAFFLNLIFTIIEFIGGYLTNSMAILSDAVHDLGDSISLGGAWYLQKLSNKEGNNKYSFGYKRFSTLGALISGIVLLFGSIFVLTEAVPRLFNPTHSDAQGMLWFAILGVAINGFAAWRLHGGSSMNEKVLSWHLLEDILGWVGVLIISIVMLFKDIHILDPILSIVITCFILFNVIRNLIKTMKVFLDAVPDEVDMDAIRKEIEGINGVERVAHLHIWSIDGEENTMITHLYTSKNTAFDKHEEIKEKVRNLVSEVNINHSTIEIHAKEN
ncbi:cation diffusion facilitator family transporter [Rossellomorea aquimaris]|uniref:Cobalt-zinc-cadmium efflux system protein n=1 Tax=Rossellomorea aquimaris TaxID=189382 RepID=A0A366EVM9_9BACI|nr:cation diffusion facilitator family transporter [Rossellomorea aquimaris]RBP05559.1 cobalt-zinc-cadmium efflux system protein [Rossellomorea aquimaris]